MTKMTNFIMFRELYLLAKFCSLYDDSPLLHMWLDNKILSIFIQYVNI